MNWRHWTLLFGILAAIAITFSLRPIPQNESYHNFADQRALLGVPHCLDVASNIPFLIVGIWGIVFIVRSRNSAGVTFADSLQRLPYLFFFLGVTLTAFGSAYYHLHPDDDRLVWDRLPMTLAFLSLVGATLGERISSRIAAFLVGPLLLFGVFSVLYWHSTQTAGHGDLRLYALAQFGSLLAILLLLALFKPGYTRGTDLLIALGIYVLAKLLELADHPIYSLGHIVSGHTLKHLAAAMSGFWILRMLHLRRPITA